MLSNVETPVQVPSRVTFLYFFPAPHAPIDHSLVDILYREFKGPGMFPTEYTRVRADDVAVIGRWWDLSTLITFQRTGQIRVCRIIS
jgi:hypothetical protein